MKKRRVVLLLMLAMALFMGGVMGFGLGFEFGTGLPVISLFAQRGEDALLPDSMTIKTLDEAKQVVAEAVAVATYDVGYNCLDYAWTSMRALNWDGQPAAIAAIMYEDTTGHALVLTATTDENWTFLDPQTGIKVSPVPGGYWAGKKIVAVKIMVIHWIDFEEFELNPVFEVWE